MNIISVTELKKKLDQGETLLIDVREPTEYKVEHIPNACLIPLGEICLEKLPAKSGMIVIHCGSGGRSARACAQLLAEDPNLNVYSLDGGIKAWKNAGYTVKNYHQELL